MQHKTQDESIKRGANLLRQGATLTDLSCPECASPLFRLNDGSLWCIKDEKRVIIIKEGQNPPKQTTTSSPYEKLESTLMQKVQDIQSKIERSQEIEELQKLSLALSELLNSLEKIKKLKN